MKNEGEGEGRTQITWPEAGNDNGVRRYRYRAVCYRLDRASGRSRVNYRNFPVFEAASSADLQYYPVFPILVVLDD